MVNINETAVWVLQKEKSRRVIEIFNKAVEKSEIYETVKIKDKLFYNVKDIMDIFGIKKSSAYTLIKELNQELINQGYIVQGGKINTKYFRQRVYIG